MFGASILDSNPFPRVARSMRCRTSILLHTQELLMVRHLCFVFKTWFGGSVRNMNANWFWSNPCCCHHNRTAYLYFNSWTSSKKCLMALVQPAARNHVLLSRVVIYAWINNITTLLPQYFLVAICKPEAPKLFHEPFIWKTIRGHAVLIMRTANISQHICRVFKYC